MSELLNALSEFEAKVVLIGARPYERLGSPLPDPAVFNRDLALYTESIKRIASARDITFIDLAIVSPPVQLGILQEREPRNWRVLPHHEGLTDDGLHFTANGYRVLASQIALALKLPARPASISLDDTAHMIGGEVSDYHRNGDEIRFSFRRDQLTLPNTQTERNPEGSDVTVKVHDLRRGKYTFTVDGQHKRTLTSSQLRGGVVVSHKFTEKQIKQLQYLIVEKNMLFFHRHRPQNETYLFLFRKHEQGNNAVEIPQFDPLIESVEKLIDDYAVPKTHTIRIEPFNK